MGLLAKPVSQHAMAAMAIQVGTASAAFARLGWPYVEHHGRGVPREWAHRARCGKCVQQDQGTRFQQRVVRRAREKLMCVLSRTGLTLSESSLLWQFLILRGVLVWTRFKSVLHDSVTKTANSSTYIAFDHKQR